MTTYTDAQRNKATQVSEKKDEKRRQAAQRAARWHRYLFAAVPSLLPLGEQDDYDADAIRDAGLNPKDESVTVCTLAEEWTDHHGLVFPAGARVVVGLTVTGHPFAVEETEF